MNTVKQLRQSGNKVRVFHIRNMKDGAVDPRGGTTRVEITLSDGINIIGEALCSLKDNYNKKTGVKIALGRALKNVK
jgi:hypothetical protein